MTKQQIISYGLLGFSKDLLMSFSGGLLMLYFTDGVELSPVLVGGILFFGRLLDALYDIVVAYLIDYFSISHKKCYLSGVLSSIIIFLCLFSLGSYQHLSFLIPLICIFYFLLGISYTLMDVSYWSMLSRLSKTDHSETILSTVATCFSSGAALLGFSTALPLLHLLGGNHLIDGFFKLSLLLSSLIVVILLLSYPSLPDVRADEVSRKEGDSLVSMVACYQTVFRSKAFLKYIVYFFFFQLSFEWMNSFNIYYFKYSINQEFFFSLYAFTIMAQLAAASLYPKCNRYLSASHLFLLSSVLSTIGMLMLFIFGRIAPNNALLMFLAASMKQMGSGLFMVSATVDLARSIHLSQLETGVYTPAILTSVKLLVAKFTMALAGLGVGMCLSFSGYISNTIQTDDTSLRIGLYALILPVFMILLSCYFYVGFKRYLSLKHQP
ncbi:MFS transporter [Streptococcus phocae subsp. phocae]